MRVRASQAELSSAMFIWSEDTFVCEKFCEIPVYTGVTLIFFLSIKTIYETTYALHDMKIVGGEVLDTLMPKNVF